MFRRLQRMADRYVVRKAVGRCDESGLIRAIETGNVHILDLMLQLGISPDCTDARGTPALLCAVTDGNIKALRLLSEKGANLNATDAAGRTAMMRAVEEGSFLLFEYLLEKGADISCKDHRGEDVLFKAVRGGHSNIVQRLLARGADPDTGNLGGICALFLACELGFPGIVKALLAFGANPNLPDPTGRAPMDIETLTPRIEDLLFEAGGRPTERIKFAKAGQRKSRIAGPEQRNPWFLLTDLALETLEWVANPASTARPPWAWVEERGKEILGQTDLTPWVSRFALADKSLGIRENLEWLLSVLMHARDISLALRGRILLPDGVALEGTDRLRAELLAALQEFSDYLGRQRVGPPAALAVASIYGDGPFKLSRWLAPAGDYLQQGAAAAEVLLPSGLKIRLRTPKAGWLTQLASANDSWKGDAPIGIINEVPDTPPPPDPPVVDAELVPFEEEAADDLMDASDIAPASANS